MTTTRTAIVIGADVAGPAAAMALPALPQLIAVADAGTTAVTAPAAKGQGAPDTKHRLRRRGHHRARPAAGAGQPGARRVRAASPEARTPGLGRTVMRSLIGPDSDLRVSATFPGKPEEIRRVRAVLRPMLQGCPAADEVVLCASELAANAVLHSDTRKAGGTFTVRAQIRPRESVTIEVEDDGGCWAERRPDPARGRGLDIVEALTDDWGVRDIGKRRLVWTRLGWSAGC